MTVSAFVDLERTVVATEARRTMEAAQAALYPQLKSEPARRLWMSWERAAVPPPPPSQVARRQPALFTFNGEPIEPADLKRRLRRALGRGLVA